MSKESLIFGIHAVKSALSFSDANDPSVLNLWVDRSRKDPKIQSIIDLARDRNVNVEFVNRNKLDKMCDGRHQGIAAMSRAPKVKSEKDLDALLDKLQYEQKIPPFLLVLDGVQDPHNLGACLRTADAAGVHAIIVPKDKSASITPTVRKVSTGADQTVPLMQVTNLARTLKEIQQRGIWTVGTAGETDQSIYQVDLKGPLAIIMGTEEKGMRRLTREHCDLLVKIPMHGMVESLNVSVATGVCLFEANRQRGD